MRQESKSLHKVILGRDGIASFLFFAVSLCVAPAVHAATITASTCNNSAVQTAINAAADGDTVSIPAGTCAWTTGVTVTAGITLHGAGIDATIITDDVPIIGSTQNPTLTFSTTLGKTYRLSGLTFQRGTASKNFNNIRHLS